MTGTRRPRNVIAVTPGGDLTLDHIIGFHVLSSIPDAGVSSTKLRRAWIAAGMDPALVPKNRKAVHAFQVACRSIETRRGGTSATNAALKQVEVRVDEVMETADECVYQVTHLVRDRDNRIIEHPKAMRVIFTKNNGDTIRWEPLDQLVMDSKALDALGARIQKHYDDNANRVPGAKVREAIRKTLDSLHGTTICNGKMTFVPKSGRSTLSELEDLLGSVYAREDYEFCLIPVANDVGQKELIERHFTANVTDSCNKLLADIAARIKDDKGVRSDRMANMLEQKREIEKQAAKYRDLLDLSLGQVDEQLLLLNEGLENLVTKAGAAALAAA